MGLCFRQKHIIKLPTKPSDLMRLLTKFLPLFLVIFSTLGLNYVSAAPSLTIYTKAVYQYGDHLSISFEVSELTGEPITFQIRDESGKQSQRITIQITKLKTEITAPGQFDLTVYKPGTYHIDAEYSGSKVSVAFTLTDSGKIVIPQWVKNLGNWWVADKISDKDFASGIQFMIKEKIIKIPIEQKSTEKKEVQIPQWVKNNAGWWAKDLISDSDFAQGIQYMIRNGIIIV